MSSITKNIQNTAKQFSTDPRELLLKAQKTLALLITEYLWVGIILLLLAVTWYYRRQINKKANNDNAMKAEYTELPITIGSISESDAQYTIDKKNSIGHLRDYYIASSYNSCCAGDFQDGYVSLTPLREVIGQGARVLDFALYQVDDDVVVGAGPTDSDNIKGTYNSLPIGGNDGILNTINKHAFSHPCPNPTDPLFINFRIKSRSNPQLFYRKLTK